MNDNQLARSLDLLIKSVEGMEQTRKIALVLQGLKHAQYHLTGE